MSPQALRRIRLRLFVLLPLLGAGCDEGEPGVQIYPVTGKVLVDGKPAAKAKIVFNVIAGAPSGTNPYAVAEEDGSFRPSTRKPHDGAPAGAYTVTITWPGEKNDKGESTSGRDRLKGKYSDPQHSDLHVTIIEGENEIPAFELKSQ